MSAPATPSDRHNAALAQLLKGIILANPTEEGQWVILESLCLGIGLLHGRTERQTAFFVETMAERIASGERIVRPASRA